MSSHGKGLESMLNDNADFNVIASAANVPELFTALGRKRKVDLVVLDLRLRMRASLSTTSKRLKSALHNIVGPIFVGKPYLLRQVRNQCGRSLEQNAAVRGSRRGDPAYLSGKPAISTEMAAAMDGDPLLEAVDLSDQQREVLELYASGEPAKRVASFDWPGNKIQSTTI